MSFSATGGFTPQGIKISPGSNNAPNPIIHKSTKTQLAKDILPCFLHPLTRAGKEETIKCMDARVKDWLSQGQISPDVTQMDITNQNIMISTKIDMSMIKPH